jgi:aldehyde dehydrogenase (NAD+)
MYNRALTKVVEQGGKILVEGGVLSGEGTKGMLCETCNCRSGQPFEIVQHETFGSSIVFIEIFRNCRKCA